MAKNYGNQASIWVLVILLIIGGLAGSAVGNILAPVFPLLQSTDSIGLRPATLDLGFISMTFGFTVIFNPLTVIGLILGFIVYKWV